MKIINPNRLELLAPGGSFTSVKAAYAAGADAVYMGGSRFSARAYAESVSEENALENAIDYAHLHEKSLYVTVNTLLKEEEMEGELFDYILPLYESGVDAILVQDLGVLNFLHREFPDLPLHASTQMTLMNPDGASLLKSSGVTRVVAPRELNLKELSALSSKTGMELEAFIHGAICYCYSGQCLHSGVIGGRSGNRGRCAQPCRLPYTAFDQDGKRLNPKSDPCLLSLKDMNTLRFLPDLIEAGVMSFKIEGRMKSPVYTAGVVSVYRKYMDLYLEKGSQGFQVDPQDQYALSQYFDRGGTTDYLTRHNGKEMMATKEKPKLRLPDQKLLSDTEKKYVGKELKEEVTAYISVRTGEQATITYVHDKATGFAMSEDLVTPALKSPLTAQSVEKQFGKTGATAFSVKNFETDVTGDAFLPVQAMNQMRREALAQLEEGILTSYRRVYQGSASRTPMSYVSLAPVKAHALSEAFILGATGSTVAASGSAAATPGLSVVPDSAEKARLILEASTPAQFAKCLTSKAATTLYLDSPEVSMTDLPAYAKAAHENGKELFLVMPKIMREPALKEFEKSCHEIFTSGIDGIVACSMDGLGFLARRKCPLPLVLDHSFYSWNREAMAFVHKICKEKGLRLLRSCVPLELNEKELKQRGLENSELFIYGAIPMMTTAGCIRQTTTGCNHKKDRIRLVDRKNASFTDVACCKYCYNMIYNSVPVYLLDRMKELKRTGATNFRLAFTVESEKEMNRILSDLEVFAAGLAGRGQGPEHAPESMTRGHFLRGVQ